jgi:tRNA threonylcarbamoyladenosine biosynthesis protein TsaB
MGEVYHAAYVRVAGAWQRINELGLYKPDAVPLIEGAGWVGAGSGWQTYNQQLSVVYTEQLQAVQPQLLPSATAILELARPIFANGEAKPASEAIPIYIRNRVALKTLEREQGLRL